MWGGDKGERKVNWSPMIKWRDAYTSERTSLKVVRSNLYKSAICKTYGRVAYKDKTYTVIERHSTAGCLEGNDYFIIPTSLILKKSKT